MRRLQFGNLPIIGVPAFLFASAPPEGGGTPAPTPAPSAGNADTGAGNSGDPASGDSGENNTSQTFDASTFWGSQDPDGSGSPDSESASGDDSGSDTGTLKQQLTERLDSLNFGDPVMTPEIQEAFQNGDFSGFQTALNGALGQAVRQSLGLTTAIMKPFAAQIMAEVKAQIAATMGNRDDNDQLIKDFPTAKDPTIRPIVQNLYTQALKNTGGKRAAAVEQVKSMMRLVSSAAADDLGLNVAPRSADDSGRPPRVVNWIDELTSRE